MSETIIYGLQDSSGDRIGYVGRSVRPEQRFKQHLSNGRRQLRYGFWTGFLPLPITRSKSNWLAFLLLNQTPLILVELDVVSQGYEQIAEKYWFEELLKEGHPLTNGYRGNSWMGSYGINGFNCFKSCPYTQALPQACLKKVRDFMRPNIDTHRLGPNGGALDLKSYTLDRLYRQRPDLYARVLDDDDTLTANAAAIEAGWRQRMISVPVHDPERTLRTLRKHMSAEVFVELEQRFAKLHAERETIMANLNGNGSAVLSE